MWFNIFISVFCLILSQPKNIEAKMDQPSERNPQIIESRKLKWNRKQKTTLNRLNQNQHIDVFLVENQITLHV